MRGFDDRLGGTRGVIIPRHYHQDDGTAQRGEYHYRPNNPVNAITGISLDVQLLKVTLFSNEKQMLIYIEVNYTIMVNKIC